MKSGDLSVDTRNGIDSPRSVYRYSSAHIPDLVIFIDLLSILIGAVGSFVFVKGSAMQVVEYYIFCTGFVAFVSIMLLRRSGMYEINAIMRPVGKSDLVIVSIVSSILFFLTIAFSLKVTDIYSRLWIYSFTASSIALVSMNRVLLCRLLQSLSRHRVIGRSMVVLGTGPQAERFLQRIGKVKPFFTEIGGVYALDPRAAAERSEIEGHPVTGEVSALLSDVRRGRVDDVVVAMPWSEDAELNAAIDRLKELPVNVYISTDLIGYQLAFRPAFGQLSELPLFEVVQRPISGWSSLLKVLEDYTIAGLLLLILSPLLIAIAVAIKLDSPGPVFFMQRRLGFNNKEFEIYKFRSMYHREHPDSEVRQAQRNDPRITRVGRIIRRTSLDELPQLLNVLNGTMSLVGPRPHALRHNEDFGRQIRGYFARHKVKPGITGWAQVNGLRGETETLSKMEARVAHDVYYAENRSLLFDLRILMLTAFVGFVHRNAY